MNQPEPAPNVVDFNEHRTADQAAMDLAPVLSEDYVALEFIDRNIANVRFDWTRRNCYVWQGYRWQPDKTAVAASWTRSLVRAFARTEQSPTDRRRLGSRKFVDGVEALARTDQRVAVTHVHWDRGLDVLGTPT